MENNYRVSHGIVAKLTSAAEFSDAEDLAKQYGGLIYKQGTRYSRLPTFHTVYDFFTIFCLDKNVSPYFPFHNVGMSAAGLLGPSLAIAPVEVRVNRGTFGLDSPSLSDSEVVLFNITVLASVCCVAEEACSCKR